MRCGSITDAAGMMHISQPSVSRLIADLERSAGFPLFLRAGRGLTPTVEARTFYRGVEDMFVGLQRLQELAESIKTTSSGVISIGTIQSIATVELPIAVNKLYQRYDDIQFMIHSRNTPAIVDAVQMHQLDIGIVGRQPNYDGVDILYQTTAPYVCLLPEDHALVGRSGSVDLNDLAETETFVTFGGVFPDEMMSIDSGLSEKLRQRSRLSAANMPVAAALVRETGAFAIADPFSAEQAVRMGGVAFRPLAQDLTYHLAIITPGRQHVSRHALEFAEIFEEQLRGRIAAVSSFGD